MENGTYSKDLTEPLAPTADSIVPTTVDAAADNGDYSTEIADAISKFLAEDDWRFSFDGQKGRFNFSVSIAAAIKKIIYDILVHEDSFTVYAASPIGPDEKDREQMTTAMEFICRANYGLRNGNFELDLNDGEIRYKSFVDCEGAFPSREIVKNSIYVPAAMFKRYSEGITSILYKNATAKEAIEKCESNS